MNTKKIFGYGMRSLLRAIILMVGVMLVFSFSACDNGDKGDNGPNTPATPQPFNDITAAQLVANIKVGLNLGNTLDATDYGEGWLPPDSTIKQMETLWDSPVTTKAMITAIKDGGFNTIRIPVSWTKATSGAPHYTIRSDWMARVVDVVNYAVENDMYIVLNTHHDDEVFTLRNSNAAAGQAAFQKIWEQIAGTFKNYDEKLIFEALNEPRTKGSANEWSGGTAEERNNLNAYYSIFVNTVRNSGGNNDKRILMINTYATRHEQSAIEGLTLPADTVSNKLVVSIHSYSPYSFTSDENGPSTWSSSNPSDTAGVTNPMDRVYNKFGGNGIPVIIGEFNSNHKNNEDARAAHAEFFVSEAGKRGIKCIWWDVGGVDDDRNDHGHLFNRLSRTFNFPKVLAALMRGATVTPSPVIPPGSRGIIISPYVYDNARHGYKALFSLNELLGSSIKVNTGDTFTFTYAFTSNVAIGDLRVVLADTRGAVNYWDTLSDYGINATNGKIGAVTVGTTVTGTKTITATKTAGDSSNEANQFVLDIPESDTTTTSAPTLTFTTFKLVKN